MSGSTGVLMELLEGHDPAGIAFYRDDEAREDLVGLCKLLAPEERPPRRTATIEDVFRDENRDAVLLLTPPMGDEAEALRTMEGRREQLLARDAPAILFLLRGGAAETVLNRDVPALASFLRGLTYDPEAPVNEADLEDRRAAFEQKHGRTPSQWLDAWGADEIADTGDNNLWAHEAWVLRRP
jgi:hypothetical protein